MEGWAYIIGTVIGSIAVLTACVVWYRKQIFGTGGATLSFVGMVLIGMSVWGSVQITLPGVAEIRAEIRKQSAEMQKQSQRITKVAGAARVVSEEVAKLAGISDANGMQSAEFAASKKVSRDGALSSVLERIRTSKPPVDKVDGIRLGMAMKSLSTAMGGD